MRNPYTGDKVRVHISEAMQVTLRSSSSWFEDVLRPMFWRVVLSEVLDRSGAVRMTQQVLLSSLRQIIAPPSNSSGSASSESSSVPITRSTRAFENT